MMRVLSVLLELAAVAAIVAGVAMVSVAASFVVAGGLGLVASWRLNAVPPVGDAE